MIINSKFLKEYNEHLEFLILLKKIVGDKDVKMEHVIMAMIENETIKHDYFDIKYPRLRDGLELPRQRDFGYVECVESLPLERFVSIIKNISPTYGIFAFLCAYLYFDTRTLMRLSSNQSFNIIGDKKIPGWLLNILEKQKNEQSEYGNENLFLPFGMSRSIFANHISFVKKQILLRYKIDFEKYKKEFWHCKYKIRRKEIKLFEKGQGCIVNGLDGIVIHAYKHGFYLVQFSDKIRICPFYMIKKSRINLEIKEKVLAYGKFNKSTFTTNKDSLWKVIMLQLQTRN